MSSSAGQLLSKYNYLFNNEKICAEIETKFGFISPIWDDDRILRLDTKTGDAYGVIQVSNESMLPRLLLTQWGRMVCIIKVVMFLRKNLI